MWTPQLKAALVRAAVGSLLAFGTTAGVTSALTNGQWQLALSLGGVSVMTYLVFRGGLEGLYDASRAASGNVKPGDVQANPLSQLPYDVTVTSVQQPPPASPPAGNFTGKPPPA